MCQEEIEDKKNLSCDENKYPEIVYQLKEVNPQLKDISEDEYIKALSKYPIAHLFCWLAKHTNSPLNEILLHIGNFLENNPPSPKKKYKKWLKQNKFKSWESDLSLFIKEIYSRYNTMFDDDDNDETILMSTIIKVELASGITLSQLSLYKKIYFWLYFLFIENRRNGLPYNFIQYINQVYNDNNTSNNVAIEISNLIKILTTEFPALREPIKQYFHYIRRDLDALIPTSSTEILTLKENTKILPHPIDDQDSDLDTTLHFNMPLKGKQVEYLYKELKGIYISNNTDFDMFCYRLVGKMKPKELKKIIWLKEKEDLSVFIGLLAESSQKWKLTEDFFIIPNQNLKNLATYYCKYSMKKKDITIKQIIENCKKKEF